MSTWQSSLTGLWKYLDQSERFKRILWAKPDLKTWSSDIEKTYQDGKGRFVSIAGLGPTTIFVGLGADEDTARNRIASFTLTRY